MTAKTFTARLYRKAKDAFGYNYPNYAPEKLATEVCIVNGLNLVGTFFYTGVPLAIDKRAARWQEFWNRKLAVMGTRNVKVFRRDLRYSNESIVLPDGTITVKQVGREKGIDVRLALDVVRKAIDNEYDVALIFNQDQDLSEAADEVKSISCRDRR